MDRHMLLLNSYRETVSKLRIEAEALIDRPAKYLDPDLSIEPSTGVTLYARARQMRASFVKDFPLLADRVPSLNYKPKGGILPEGSLDRADLRELVSDLDQFVQLLPVSRAEV